MGVYKIIDKCRICGSSDLTEVLNFGEQYLSSYFVKSNDIDELSKIKVPLTVMLCDKAKNPSGCGALQLRETVDRDVMYRNYFYRSATNPMMKEALQDIVRDLSQKISLKKSDWVLDVGCNDGTMLTYFPDRVRRIGMDPAQNVDISNLDESVLVIRDYFSKDKALQASQGNLFKAITSIAMFYDLDDPHSFVSEIKSSLAPDGVWCLQLSYLPKTLETLNFYDVCHEHLFYYYLRVLTALLEKHNLYVFDASLNEVNGGSIRIFATHKSNFRPISDNLKHICDFEDAMHLSKPETYTLFNKRIDDLKSVILDFIKKEKENNGLIIGLGASTKGNVLLQFFNIGKQMLPYISERNPEKVGLRTLGTDIEIISEDRARELNPSAMLVLIWHFKDEIVKREAEYLAKGGKLLFPMPYPHIVAKYGETKL